MVVARGGEIGRRREQTEEEGGKLLIHPQSSACNLREMYGKGYI